MIGAKAQPTNTLLPVVKKQKNVELRTNTWVRRIVHKDGRATGVQYTDANGEEYFQPANIVVVGTFTLNNVRLLLLSKIGTPYDPVTRKGSLGRNLTHQVQGPTRVYFEKPLNLFMGAGGLGFASPISRAHATCPESENLYCLGGHLRLQSAGGRASHCGIRRDAAGRVESNWGSEWKKAALEVERSASRPQHRRASTSPIARTTTTSIQHTTDKFGDPAHSLHARLDRPRISPARVGAAKIVHGDRARHGRTEGRSAASDRARYSRSTTRARIFRAGRS